MAASRKGILRYQTERTPRVSIAAIPTRYAGCRFRSRLEARWAVFFDAMGIEWQYEPQGYKVGKRPYLPDFLLTDREYETWVEVKGSDAALNKNLMKKAAAVLGGLVILGPVPDPDPLPAKGKYGTPLIAWPHLEGDSHFPERASACSFGYNTVLTNPPYMVPGIYDQFDLRDKDDWLKPFFTRYQDDDYAIQARHAYLAARGARFEHGESGAGPARCSDLRPW
jgi:hypothetical protein